MHRILTSLTTITAVVLLTTSAWAHHKPDHVQGPPVSILLPPPETLTCGLANGTVVADWADLDGATKYSVDVVAEYDTDADGLADLSLDFDYGVDVSEVSFPLADLAVEGAALTSVKLRVKGLNPPGGPQNHPFSAFCVVM